MIWGKREKKENPAGAAYYVNNFIEYTFDKNKDALAKEGYARNVIVYRAIKEISDATANITVMVKSGDKEIERGPINELLKKPNPMQGWDTFCKNVFTDYLINGEMFIAGEGQKPNEIWPLNPLKISVKAGPGGIPSEYVHNEKSPGEKRFPVERLTGFSDVFYHKMYNPLNYWRGMSPLEAAALAGDVHNTGLVWNYSLLKNGASPSGIVKFQGTPGQETISFLREFFKKTLQGSRNAGEVPVLVEGADWQETSKTPRDMDYLSTMKETAKYVASAYGVPLPLVDNDAASYNNIEQAKERLWTDTVLPLFNEFLNSFSSWLSWKFGVEIMLGADIDSIPALEGVRKRRFERMTTALEKGAITIDEWREEMGYDPLGGMAAVLMIPANRVPIDTIDESVMNGSPETPQ